MSEYAQIPGTGSEDDLVLIKLVLAGDRRAFEPLVRKHERRVFRVTLAVLGNLEDAEEAMQDAFIKAYWHLDQFRGESRFTTWLTRIAVSQALRKESVSLDESSNLGSRALPRRFVPWTSNPEKL